MSLVCCLEIRISFLLSQLDHTIAMDKALAIRVQSAYFVSVLVWIAFVL